MIDYTPSFKIILHAGNSKSKSREALSLSKNKQFNEANDLLLVAREELDKAHRLQTEVMQIELKENISDINMLMVHAQDHVTSAEVVLEMAEEINLLRQEFTELKETFK